MYDRYRKRFKRVLCYGYKMLKTDIDLTGDDTIILDREKLGHFKTKKEPRDYWERQLKFQLMSITLGREDEQESRKCF